MPTSNFAVRYFNRKSPSSLLRAIEPAEDGGVESEFLSNGDVQYIHGTSESFVKGTLTRLPTNTKPSNILNQDKFSLEGDVDAISDMVLSVSLDINSNTTIFNNAYASSTTIGHSTESSPPFVSTVAKDFLLSMINKIEIRLGHVTIQTILPEEIFLRNITEHQCNSLDEWISGGVTATGVNGFTVDTHVDSSLPASGNTVNERIVYNELKKIGKIPRGENIILVRDGTKYTWKLNIPFNGRSLDLKKSLLTSNSNINNPTVIVFYNSAFPNGTTGSKQASRNNVLTSQNSRGVYSLIRDLNCAVDTSSPFGVVSGDTPGKSFVDSYTGTLSYRTHTFTPTEAAFVRENIINRFNRTSQSISREILGSETLDVNDPVTPRNGASMFNADSTTKYSLYSDLFLPAYTTSDAYGTLISHKTKPPKPISIDLGNFDLIASHLLIAAFAPTHNSDGSVSVSPLEMGWEITNGTNSPGVSWDPHLDYSSLNPLATPSTTCDLVPYISSELLSFTGYSVADKAKCMGPFGCSMRGVLENWLERVDLSIGNHTVPLNAASLLKVGGEFGLKTPPGVPVYVIPLADAPFSTAGIPLSRVGTKKIHLHLDQRYGMHRGPFTQVNGSYDNPVNSGTQSWTANGLRSWSPITKVSVVAVGNKVQTSAGGVNNITA